ERFAHDGVKNADQLQLRVGAWPLSGFLIADRQQRPRFRASANRSMGQSRQRKSVLSASPSHYSVIGYAKSSQNPSGCLGEIGGSPRPPPFPCIAVSLNVTPSSLRG